MQRLLLLPFVLSLGAMVRADGWRCSSDPLPVKLAGFEGDMDLSAIAKAGNFVLVGSDELSGVQTGTLDAGAGTIQFESLLALVDDPSPETKEKQKKKQKKKKESKATGGETDVEGICYSAEQKAFFVTGSHGVGKKKGDFQRQRYSVYRIPFDSETREVASDDIAESSLLPWLETSAEFKECLRQPLQWNGFNIEGLAAAGRHLYFGVRAPSVDGMAFIVEVNADKLFENQGREIQPAVHRVELGPDTGIRELVRVRGGFLILTGNAGAEATKKFPAAAARREDAEFGLYFVARSGPGTPGKPVRIGNVSATGGKAEGLLVLEEADRRLRIAILHDGLSQGGAAGFILDRPEALASAAR